LEWEGMGMGGDGNVYWKIMGIGTNVWQAWEWEWKWDLNLWK